MRRLASASLIFGVALLGACTKDFSRFQFREGPPVAKPETAGASGNHGSDSTLGRNQIGGDAAKPMAGATGSSATSAGRSANARTDGGSGGRASTDAGGRAAASTAGRSAPSDEDAGTLPDAQMPDASKPVPDAGPTLEQQCATSAGRDLSELPSGCTSCSCNACAPSVLPCLQQGDVYDRPCRDLLKCAIKSGCRDWDCYCSTPDCRTTSTAEGDGPCVEEMNTAAGDTHDRAAVDAAHVANDPSNPMTMALKATACMLGSGHGSTKGACELACDVP